MKDQQKYPYMQGLKKSDLEIVHGLLLHMANTDFRGLDPSVIQHNPRVLALLDIAACLPGVRRYWRAGLNASLRLLGHRIHWLLRPTSLRFAKGLALTTSAIAFLLSQDNEHETLLTLRTTLAYVIALLEEKRLHPLHVWAHDTAYRMAHSKAEITTSTPNLITTAFVAKAYWDLWTQTGDLDYQESFLRIVADVVTVFPQRECTDGTCIMYTPVSDYYVHNSNLLFAELLAKRYAISPREEDARLVQRCLDYSLGDFNRTQSIPYAGPPTAISAFDNYHTGYILRSLLAIQQDLDTLHEDARIASQLESGVNFYLQQFLRQGWIVRDASRMLESHSLAEAILIDKTLGHLYTQTQRQALREAIQRTAVQLWDPSGYFINCVIRLPFLGIADRTDMIRWSQTWMVYALAYEDAAAL